MIHLPRLLRRYASLSTADRRLLLRAFVGLLVTDLRLRRQGVRGALAPDGSLDRAAGPAIGPGELRRAERYARWIEAAARYHVVRARCLHRALTLHRWLRAERLPAELRIGVRKQGGRLHAHAWVELTGHVIGDRPESVGAFATLGRGNRQTDNEPPARALVG